MTRTVDRLQFVYGFPQASPHNKNDFATKLIFEEFSDIWENVMNFYTGALAYQVENMWPYQTLLMRG